MAELTLVQALEAVRTQLHLPKGKPKESVLAAAAQLGHELEPGATLKKNVGVLCEILDIETLWKVPQARISAPGALAGLQGSGATQEPDNARTSATPSPPLRGLSMAPPLEAVASRELTLMVAPNLVIGVARKLQCSGSDLAQVLAQISTELGLPNEIAVALAVPDGEQPTPITNLDQLPAKAKVQVWPAKDFATPLRPAKPPAQSTVADSDVVSCTFTAGKLGLLLSGRRADGSEATSGTEPCAWVCITDVRSYSPALGIVQPGEPPLRSTTSSISN